MSELLESIIAHNSGEVRMDELRKYKLQNDDTHSALLYHNGCLDNITAWIY